MRPNQHNHVEMWRHIRTSTDGEELRSLAEDTPSHQYQERNLIASNPHTPPDVLLSLVEEEQDVIAGEVSGDHQLSLELVRCVAENPRAPTEALRKCVELTDVRDVHTYRIALAHDNMPQDEVEARMPHRIWKSAYPWDRIFEKRGDHRSILIAELLRAGHDPRNVVQEVEAILGD